MINRNAYSYLVTRILFKLSLFEFNIYERSQAKQVGDFLDASANNLNHICNECENLKKKQRNCFRRTNVI